MLHTKEPGYAPAVWAFGSYAPLPFFSGARQPVDFSIKSPDINYRSANTKAQMQAASIS